MANKKSPSPIDRHIGSRIKMRRIMIGMSQEKLGTHLGITFQQVQKYEKGINRVGSGRLHEIGSLLGVPVSFFFEEQPGDASAADSSSSMSPTESLLAQKDSLQLLQAFSAITDPAMRRALVNMARAIAGQTNDGEALVNPPQLSRRKAFSHSSSP